MISRRRLLAATAVAPWMTQASTLRDSEIARWLVETPSHSLLANLVARIRAGLQPAELLRGLAIAACREVSPYPHVGFRYHAVMMLRSVELAVAGMPDERHWLPLLWTAAYFKRASAQQDHFRPWSLPALDRSDSNSPALMPALAAWDRDAADRAAHDMVIRGQSGSALQTLMLHAARDFRAIGHKTIAAANAHRLHGALGADLLLDEPLVRSLALAVQNRAGNDDPARHEYLADRDWKANRSIAAALRGDWASGREDIAAARTLFTEAMLENYRQLRFPWRDRLLAASLMYANASSTPDDGTVLRAQSLLKRANGAI